MKCGGGDSGEGHVGEFIFTLGNITADILQTQSLVSTLCQFLSNFLVLALKVS